MHFPQANYISALDFQCMQKLGSQATTPLKCSEPILMHPAKDDKPSLHASKDRSSFLPERCKSCARSDHDYWGGQISRQSEVRILADVDGQLLSHLQTMVQSTHCCETLNFSHEI